MKWSKKRPTFSDDGQWFFVKQDCGVEFPIVHIVEVRLDEKNGKVYLCQPCDQGVQAQSYGTLLNLYGDNTSFAGPIQLPDDFSAIRKQYYNSKEHKIRKNL